MYVLMTNLRVPRAYSEVGYDTRKQALKHWYIETCKHPHNAPAGIRDLTRYSTDVLYRGEIVHTQRDPIP